MMSRWTHVIPWSTACLACVLLGGVYAQSAASGPARNETLQAQRFVVIDEHGSPQAVFGMERGAVRLRIPATIGSSGVVVGKYPENNWSGVALFDDEGKRILAVGQDKDAGAGLALYDTSHQLRCSLSSDDAQNPVLNMFDAHGRVQIGLGPDEKGRPTLALTAWGHPNVDSSAKKTAGLVVYITSDGAGRLVFRDEHGKTVLSLPKE